MTCTATSTAQPEQYTNFALVTGVPPTGGVVQDLDNSNYFGAIGSIVIVKSTNGVDANDAPGPLILDGQPVNWTYDVTDSGNTTVTNVQVTDDHADVVVTCPKTTLAPQETMRCTANGTAAEGQYDNVGTVTATGPTGALTASDPSNYFGAEPVITIQKLTNGDDANAPTGPVIPIGDPVTWTYVVTNPGNIALHDVHVVDDKGVVPVFQNGDANNDGILDPGETWNYQATGTATAGQYENKATVTGTVPFEQPMTVTASDPSHYLGEDPGIAIDKSVDKSVVAPGETVTYTITVTNTGNVALHDVVVSDPKVPACNRTIGDLAPGQSVSYICSFVVTEPIDNVATVTGKNNVTVAGTDDARVGLVAGTATGASSGGGGGGGGTLPFTGSTPLAIALVGILAVAGGLGAASLDRSRRRRARAWLDDKTRSIRSRLKPTF
jgi:hypothetical protein